jgi:hypothetical protein
MLAVAAEQELNLFGLVVRLSHCATSPKVAGSIPELSLGFFIDLILAAVWPCGLLNLLTKVSTRGISWGVKAAGV